MTWTPIGGTEGIDSTQRNRAATVAGEEDAPCSPFDGGFRGEKAVAAIRWGVKIHTGIEDRHRQATPAARTVPAGISSG